jgi:sugar lactone lactonase YvrE
MASPAGGGPRIALSTVRFTASGLNRPECVLATSSGALYTADWRGGVAQTLPDGSAKLFVASPPLSRPLRPNGIALRPDGSFLLADLGDTQGGIFRLERNGTVTPFLEAVDGIPLPPSNYVVEDGRRTWLTVSTRHQPRALAYRSDVADGFIAVVDHRGARIVADALCYTNEAVPSPDGRWLYVNETFARRLTRFRIGADGTLSAKETVTTFGHGTYPDGLSFDAEGGIWITSIVSNRVIRVLADGSQDLMLEDCDPAHVEWVEQAFQSGNMGRPHLDRTSGRVLKNISSLAFGGPGLRTAYLGCLLDDRIPYFDAPVAGYPPYHWNF